MTAGPRPKVKCPVCGTEFGDLVSACPKCGAMNPAHRGGPPTTHVATGPAPYSPPPPPPAQPAYYGQQPPPGQPVYYGQPPAGAPPPGYGQYPGAYPGQYPPGYGAPPQKSSGLAIGGMFFAIAALVCILLGVNLLLPACGGFALVFSIIGLILGIMMIGKEPQAAKAVIGFNATMLITVVIIVIIMVSIFD